MDFPWADEQITLQPGHFYTDGPFESLDLYKSRQLLTSHRKDHVGHREGSQLAMLGHGHPMNWARSVSVEGKVGKVILGCSTLPPWLDDIYSYLFLSCTPSTVWSKAASCLCLNPRARLNSKAFELKLAHADFNCPGANISWQLALFAEQQQEESNVVSIKMYIRMLCLPYESTWAIWEELACSSANWEPEWHGICLSGYLSLAAGYRCSWWQNINPSTLSNVVNQIVYHPQ